VCPIRVLRLDEEPIAAVVDRYDLDGGVLDAAVRSALAVPDRVVVLDVLPPVP